MTNTFIAPTQNQMKEDSSPEGEPPLVTNENWNDWEWQIRNSITTLDGLSKYISLTDIEKQSGSLPLRITPYYAQLLSNPAIRKCVVPTVQELEVSSYEAADSLAEERDRKTEHIIHRYPDRVLFLVTNICASNCRYCTRSRLIDDSSHAVSHNWGPSFEYIRNHPEIRDVLISGGDPLLLSDEKITELLENLYAIPHVEIVRIGTKVPVVLPMRITQRLLGILSRFSPLYISIHFTHPAELTPETSNSCVELRTRGFCVLGSQTVCLSGVNDSRAILGDLFKGLLKIGVKPYYCYACDLVPGSSHFRVPLPKLLEIIEGLRGWISGYAIPHFVIDGLGGKGKTPILPEYFVGSNDREYLYKNYKGEKFTYPAA
jgi:lysine 2,3-aminomutase